MNFTVEDGTGVSGATSYASTAELDAYAFLMSDGLTEFTSPQKQAALVRASIFYIDGFNFPGKPLSDVQGLKLPTETVALNNDIKRAVLAAAVLQLQGRLFVDPQDIEQRGIVSESSSVGSLSDSVTYADTASYTSKYPTNAIDKLVRPYTNNVGGLGQLVRC
ncbi:MAG: DnaT-like ssDNA-binding protein [Marinomonas gallaica]